jgi:DNA-binding CsgD family transcriptional regulator
VTEPPAEPAATLSTRPPAGEPRDASTGDPSALCRVYDDGVRQARGGIARLHRMLNQSVVPMVIVDDERRYVAVNAAAGLSLRLDQDALRRLRIDELTPPHLRTGVKAAWASLLADDQPAGQSEAIPMRGSLGITYCAVPNVVPGLHLIGFVPREWPEAELVRNIAAIDLRAPAPLSLRELEVLELAADGHNGPMIARMLSVSAATVRTHFEHIYAKLGVRDRAAAVARAMRRGLIR